MQTITKYLGRRGVLPSLLIGLSVVISGCSNQSTASYEKGGPIGAEGYVDLSPPTAYSPKRGVICESLNVDDQDRLTGACYDLFGPSVALTAEYISQSASETLQAKLDAGGFSNLRRFTTETGTVCDLDQKRCWFERGGKIIPAPRHTTALFWGE